jgi:hypothetical protein
MVVYREIPQNQAPEAKVARSNRAGCAIFKDLPQLSQTPQLCFESPVIENNKFGIDKFIALEEALFVVETQ